MHLANLWCFTKEATGAMRRRKLIALATLSSVFIALLVLSATLAAATNFSLLSTKLRDSAEVTVFLHQGATASQRAAFKTWAAQRPEVASVEYVSPSKALGELASELGQDSRLLEASQGNPIPPSFKIKVQEPELVDRFVSTLRSKPGVFRVVYASQATSRLVTFSRLLNLAGLALSVVLGLACVTIVHNAMAVAIEARRRDIRIMQLVGADPRLIRLPYLISGVLYGLAGAIVAALVTTATYTALADAARAALPFVPVARPARVAGVVFPLTLLAGAVFGLLGASLSVSRHLQPHRSPTAVGRQSQPLLGATGKIAVAVLMLVLLLVGTATVRADAALPDRIALAKRLGAAIAADSRSFRALGARLATSNRRLAELSRRMTILENRIAAVTRAKRAISKRVSGQLLAYYAAGRTTQLEVLTGSQDLDEAAVSSERLRFVLDAQYHAFNEARSVLDDLSAFARKLDASRREAAAVARRIASARTQLGRRKTRREALLRKLVAGIRTQVAAYGDPALGGNILIYGTDGFLFPVATTHKFSNDWHTPRSGGRLHQGTDVFAAKGAPLLSVVGGTVRISSNKLGGSVIHLDGDDGRSYYYAHLSGYAPGLASGRTVAPGELLGLVGTSGNAAGTPPHLHFEIHPGGGAPVNPYQTLVEADRVLFAP